MTEIKSNDDHARFELERIRARFLRDNDREISETDRRISRMYGWLSLHGTSYTRPLKLLSWLIFWSFVLQLTLIGVTSIGTGIQFYNLGSIFAVALLAVTISLRPFYTISPAIDARADSCMATMHDPFVPSCGRISEFHSSYDAMLYQLIHYGGLFKIASIIQSFASLLLVFLILLAIRRKFQVKS